MNKTEAIVAAIIELDRHIVAQSANGGPYLNAIRDRARLIDVLIKMTKPQNPETRVVGGQ